MASPSDGAAQTPQSNMELPTIIQGGMGVAVSGWRLARAVACEGQLGVVSGTLLPVVLARRLQLGDPDGELRRALAAFPLPMVAERVRERYFIPGGKASDTPFAAVPLPSATPSRAWVELTVLANFVEVWLAKSGHKGRVGINLLEKIQFGTLASLYGAMLADVDVVLMGAGIPRAIPGILDSFAIGEAAELTLDVTALPDPAEAPANSETRLRFSPADFWREAGGASAQPVGLRRPDFFAIVSSAALATTLARKASGRVDGFVIESPAAGGHNAPPRGGRAPGPDGQPVYGPRDEPELDKFRALGRPFWLAGERASPARLAEARSLGAAGVQVGTAFAFCEESGIDPALKTQALALSSAGKARVFTDPLASPTGFPFKILALTGTQTDATPPRERAPRACDLGYLREAYTTATGGLGYRCPAERENDYTAKGGATEATRGRQCLCNGLLAAVGLGQVRAQGRTCELEPPIVTAGNEVGDIARFLPQGASSYHARDVLAFILAK